MRVSTSPRQIRACLSGIEMGAILTCSYPDHKQNRFFRMIQDLNMGIAQAHAQILKFKPVLTIVSCYDNGIFGMAVMPFLCGGVWFLPKLSYQRNVMSIYSDKLANVQVFINCRYSIAQM